MIGYIKGTIEGIFPDSILVENHGIGYQIYTSGIVIGQKCQMNASVKMFTYMHVREDDISLFGFPTTEELDTFKLLLGVNGVGPKAALAVLSVLSVKDLTYAVMSGDAKAITKANGIGAKGANRIIMELKDKLTIDSLAGEDSISGESALSDGLLGNEIQDAVLALVSLGYSDSEAMKAVRQIPNADKLESEELLKQALKHLF